MALSTLDAAVRAAINEGFLERGAAPTGEELAHQLGLDHDAVFETLRRLAGHGSISLRPATMDVWAAPPFSATPTLHRVEIGGRVLWGGCIWCALGICALAGAPGTVRTIPGGDGAEIGQAWVFPGEKLRMDNLRERGRDAGIVVLGAVLMLFISGLIEGIMRQTVTMLEVRWAVATATALFWLWYFALCGRGAEASARADEEAAR